MYVDSRFLSLSSIGLTVGRMQFGSQKLLFEDRCYVERVSEAFGQLFFHNYEGSVSSRPQVIGMWRVMFAVWLKQTLRIKSGRYDTVLFVQVLNFMWYLFGFSIKAVLQIVGVSRACIFFL